MCFYFFCSNIDIRDLLKEYFNETKQLKEAQYIV